MPYLGEVYDYFFYFKSLYEPKIKNCSSLISLPLKIETPFAPVLLILSNKWLNDIT